MFSLCFDPTLTHSKPPISPPAFLPPSESSNASIGAGLAAPMGPQHSATSPRSPVIQFFPGKSLWGPWGNMGTSSEKWGVVLSFFNHQEMSESHRQKSIEAPLRASVLEQIRKKCMMKMGTPRTDSSTELGGFHRFQKTSILRIGSIFYGLVDPKRGNKSHRLRGEDVEPRLHIWIQFHLQTIPASCSTKTWSGDAEFRDMCCSVPCLEPHQHQIKCWSCLGPYSIQNLGLCFFNVYSCQLD